MSRILSFFCLLFSANVMAQTPAPRSLEELDLSYVYAPIFGTGLYRAGAEKAAVLRVDFNSWLLDQEADDEWYWLLPVSVGVRHTELQDIVGEILNGSLLNVSFLPGVARRYQINDQWVISPSVQLGFAHDITLDTTRALYSAAIRSSNWWQRGQDRWTFGNRIRLAGQDHPSNGQRQGFVLLESGLDWQRPLNIEFAGDPLVVSIFAFGQYFIDNTGIKAGSGEPVGQQSLFNLGFTIGWHEPKSLLGFSVHRLGMSAVVGSDLQAYMFNVGFPLNFD